MLGLVKTDSHTVPARKGCEEHIYEVLGAAIPVDYACGFLQAARCLVCDEVTPPVDADWWSERADDKDVESCLREITNRITHLTTVAEALSQPAVVQGPLRDLD